MKILNQEITTISFEDIVVHCESKIPEGVELDYKVDFPHKDLAKLIAAFSNTRGGLIIIGVNENRQTGYPSAWEGIPDDATLIEKANQLALSVSPLPNFKIKKTNDKNGKVFILIRIFEGDSTPYFVRNDSNVWTRTGNIRNPVDIASPEWLELLYKKRERADKARKNYTLLAEEVFKHALEMEDKKRAHLIEQAKRIGDGSEKNYYQKKLGTEIELCKIIIQPNFPQKAKIAPIEIKNNANLFRGENNYIEFPHQGLRPIPEGVMTINHRSDGSIDCHQIYATGLMYNCFDVLRHDRETGKAIIYISHILGGLHATLTAAKKFYTLVGYQGVIKLSINLSLKSKEVNFHRITGRNFFNFDSQVEALLPNYSWNFTLNTSELNNPNEIFSKFFEIAGEIHWYLGFENLSLDLYKKFMEDTNLKF